MNLGAKVRCGSLPCGNYALDPPPPVSKLPPFVPYTFLALLCLDRPRGKNAKFPNGSVASGNDLRQAKVGRCLSRRVLAEFPKPFRQEPAQSFVGPSLPQPFVSHMCWRFLSR